MSALDVIAGALPDVEPPANLQPVERRVRVVASPKPRPAPKPTRRDRLTAEVEHLRAELARADADVALLTETNEHLRERLLAAQQQALDAEAECRRWIALCRHQQGARDR